MGCRPSKWTFDANGNETVLGRYLRTVEDKLQANWSTDNDIEGKWNVLKCALCEGARLELGYAKKRQPDWYRENANIIMPLLSERNKLYNQWLSTRQERDRLKFAAARNVARLSVRHSKEAWFESKAVEAEKTRFSGKIVWKCIQDIQRCRRGLIPVRSSLVKDENGNICATLDAQQEQWIRHFTKVLNLQSQFDMEELQKVQQRSLRSELEELPSKEELVGAILKTKNGKASGESGTLPEMLKAACKGDTFINRLLELVHDVWKAGSVPRDWCNAVLIPIPKKGDLTSCDNWRGISLLDIVGKVVARVLQDRLQKIAEDELPESQCGFRKGRGCTDMIFVVRQLVEKFWEHTSKAFSLSLI